MSWSVCPLLRDGGDNLESILIISPMADLWYPVSPSQGSGLIVLSIGDGILTHLSFRFLDPTLQCIKYIIFEYPHSPDSSTGIIFGFTYMYIHYLLHIHPPTPFLDTSLLPLVSTAPLAPQNLFCPLVLWFCRRKNIKDKMRNMTFC
jgi:hypothetical protein